MPVPPSHRPRAACGLITVAALAAVSVPSAASAAWLPSQPTAGTPQTIAVGGTPGAVAVITAQAGTFRAYVHDPGGGAGWRVASTTTFDGDALAGPGGALVVVHDSDDTSTTVDLGAYDSRGAWRSAGSTDLPGSVSASAVAVGPDGTVAAAIVDDDSGQLSVLSGRLGQPQAIRQDAEIDGRSAVGKVAMAPGATAGVNVVWNREGADGPQIWGAGVTVGAPSVGTLLARLAPADPNADDPTVNDVAAVARTGVPTAAWVQDTEDASTARAARVGGTPVDVAGSAAGLRLGAAPTRTAQGRIVVPLTDAAAGSLVAVLGDDAALVCTAPVAGTPTAVAGASPVVVAGTGDGRLSAVGIPGLGCDAGPPDLSAAVPSAPAFLASADAADDVIAATGQPEPGAIAVLDRTAPALDLAVEPADGRPARAVARTGDGWGPVTVRWSVDGRPVDPTGGELPLRDLAPGARRITATATDGAGNTTTRDADVTVPDVGAPAPPPAEETPAPEPAPGPQPVAPPATTPIPPDRPTSRPRRPSVRILGVRRVGSRWVVRVRSRDADRLRVTLFRERYLSGRTLGGRQTVCPRRATPARRPATGRRGQVTVRVSGRTARLFLSGLIAKALEHRGRYTVRVQAYSTKAPSRIASGRRRFSSC